MVSEKFLYFGSGDGADATTEAYYTNATNLRGADITGAAATTLYFKPLVIGDAVAAGDLNDKVVVTHTGQTGKEFLTALTQAMTASGPQYSDGFIVVADADAATGVGSGTAWDAAVTLAA
tara:strand:- start:52 stop:411 length:360 start_codon:yes stop_codon:yes gene_type:complete